MPSFNTLNAGRELDRLASFSEQSHREAESGVPPGTVVLMAIPRVCDAVTLQQCFNHYVEQFGVVPHVPLVELLVYVTSPASVLPVVCYSQYVYQVKDQIKDHLCQQGFLSRDPTGMEFDLLTESGDMMRNAIATTCSYYPSAVRYVAIVQWRDPQIECTSRKRSRFYLRRSGGMDNLRIQSRDEIVHSQLNIQSYSATIARTITRVMFDTQAQNYAIKLVEDVALLGYQLMTIPGHGGKISAIVAFAKLRIDGPLITREKVERLISYFDKLFAEPEIQSMESFFTTSRSFLDGYESLKSTPIYVRLHKFLMYSLATSMFDKVGITFDNLNYTKIEEEAIRKKYFKGADYIHCLLDTMLFLSERGYQCMKTGTLSAIFHSGSAYEKWYDGVLTLQRNSKFLSNPEVHGFTLPQFLMDLDDHIDKGKAIARHVVGKSEYEIRLIRRALADLELIKATELTRRAAGQDRKAPFSVLVFGGSGVAKSTFTKLLYYQFGKTFNLPTESEYRYVRNANDPFWSGFTTAKWCIQLDDIAYLNPGAAPSGDPSVLEMLQVVNSVPFVPNQAELEDKGRTPVKARFVVATSNAEDLNAFAYFNCPLAVRRRLPYVITLRPKKQYAKDEVFLDAQSVPPNIEGSYPDYWDILVQKVVPQDTEIYRQRAKLEEVSKFSDIYEFCSWFSRTAKQFDDEQNKVETSDINMARAEICLSCYKPQIGGGCMCVADNSEVQLQGLSEIITTPVSWFLEWCFSLLFSIGLFWWIMQFSFAQERFVDWMYSAKSKVVSSAFRHLGERHHRAIGKVALFVKISVVVGTLYAYFKFFSWLFLKESTVEAQMTPQGGLVSSQIGKAPKPKNEAENVWYNDSIDVCVLDMAPSGASWKQHTNQQIFDALRSNVVVVTAYSPLADGTTLKRTNRAIAVKGQIYMINNHGLPTDTDLKLEIRANVGDGVSDTHTVTIAQEEIYRHPEREVAFFALRGWAPRKNIVDYFAGEKMQCICKGFYIMVNEDGSKHMVGVRAVGRASEHLSGLGTFEMWGGVPDRDTLVGECGSPMILRSGMGPFIAGIHVAGASGYAAAVSVDRQFLLDAIYEHFDRHEVIESRVMPGAPKLNVQTTNFVIQELNRKSPFRYISQGSAKIYGSLNGFRGNIRSKVCDTPIRHLAEEYGYEVKTGAPVMNGWEPWYNAAIDMVNPVSEMRHDILDIAKQQFIEDILSRLDKDFLSEELFILDDNTAVNGAAGVKFVDKINRNSSMGFPWKRSKRFYLEDELPTDLAPDPVTFPKEVWDRVDECISHYQRGERYHPVFTGSLKDEPIKFSKIIDKKTRVFCGSPIDWNIVVRKYLLMFIRVLQLNSYIFEAAPGIVCQSREWDDLYKYLTRFGTTRMIAGDYAAFDKKMPASVILATFDIMKAVCRASGNYTDEDLLVISGIAFDTAFPLVDLNGDLVELTGSNPSGHPLTVIVNCLANSLYLRYCYIVLNPDHEAKSFKDNVSAITYGDDNVMGCSSAVPWFTHTTLAQALADIGIEYTMADKESESVPYITIEECSFLKRTWLWSNELNCYVAPLDESSIAKMLTKHIPSSVDCEEKQAVDTLSTVVREYFWYGRDKYLEKKRMCEDIIFRADLTPYCRNSTLPTWKELCDDFELRSNRRIQKRW